jgi:23S rRNA U2552 (ribose-2'-O)-methylase RlmE/FtsJ
LNDEIYLLTPGQKIPVGENLEFAPGSIVKCVNKKFQDGSEHIAAIEIQK